MRRQGFTLVELLVVIAIIGMLVGLLLPAVNAAREQGRLLTCKNNLKQLSNACAGHVIKQNGIFPSGGWGSNWVGIPDKGYGAQQPGSWIYQIMPYMDQDAGHDLGKGSPDGSSTQATDNAKRVSTALAVCYCPTRRAVNAYPIGIPPSSSYGGGANPANPMLTTPVNVACRTDYAINGGSYYIPNGQGPSSASAASSYTWPSLANFNGIAAVHSQVLQATCTDNKDTMYLIGEKYMSPENYITGQDPGDLFSAMAGDDFSLIRWACLNCPTGTATGTVLLPAMDRAASNNPPANGYQTFGSAHPSGWCVAMVGGNVRLISWGIDATTHTAMSTRNGHEIIDPSRVPW